MQNCGYFLAGLNSPGRCPECGRDFDFEDGQTFILHEPFVRWRYWLPGLIAATAVMVAAIGFNLLSFGAWGWSLWLATPMAGGVLLGYGTRTRSWRGLAAVLMLGAGAFIGAVAGFGLAGGFCGMILAVILLFVFGLGGVVGLVLRTELKRSGFSQRWYLPAIVLLLLLPCFWPGPIESIVTEQRLAVSAEEAFAALLFYEEVRHAPPWLLRVGLVRPLRTEGAAGQVGDRKKCIYNKGHITKQVTQLASGRRMDFSIVEQAIGYERDVRLAGGSFAFEPLGEHECVVRLTTNYRPLLTPRFCWRWGEAVGIHTLHRHVATGIELEALRRRHERHVALAGGSP